MHGTVRQKIGRVITDLLTHPQYISRCLSHNLAKGRTPLDLEIPWFSYSAIDYLDTYVTKTMRVFEYGSGGSTVFFAQRAQSVYSVEDNSEWFERVSNRLREKAITNVAMRLCPFDFKDPEGFEHSEYFRAMPDEKFDIIVIDGSEEWKQVRPTCFQKAEGHVVPGGIIVVDDSWRYDRIRKSHHAKSMKTLQSVGPCRPGVTSTDIFYY